MTVKWHHPNLKSLLKFKQVHFKSHTWKIYVISGKTETFWTNNAVERNVSLHLLSVHSCFSAALQKKVSAVQTQLLQWKGQRVHFKELHMLSSVIIFMGSLWVPSIWALWTIVHKTYNYMVWLWLRIDLT